MPKSSECTCNERFLTAEDYRDHLPCPGTAKQQKIRRLQAEVERLRAELQSCTEAGDRVIVAAEGVGWDHAAALGGDGPKLSEFIRDQAARITQLEAQLADERKNNVDYCVLLDQIASEFGDDIGHDRIVAEVRELQAKNDRIKARLEEHILGLRNNAESWEKQSQVPSYHSASADASARSSVYEECAEMLEEILGGVGRRT